MSDWLEAEFRNVQQANAATAEQAGRAVETLHEAADNNRALFTRCRIAGNTLAAAVRQFYEDHDEAPLRAAYEQWMSHDSGNFAS